MVQGKCGEGKEKVIRDLRIEDFEIFAPEILEDSISKPG